MDRFRSGRAYTRLEDDVAQLRQDQTRLSHHNDEAPPKRQGAASIGYSSSYLLQASSNIHHNSAVLSKTGRFSGWRFGALSGALLAIVSLVINLVAIIWLTTREYDSYGLVEVFQGDCERVQLMNTLTHLVINGISTLLLGGSNYCMQCLVAPTRREIDKEHSSGRFLDIGVPSIRNLSKVSRHKVILWWILGLSSVPLHLFYNSAFYPAIGALDYDVFIVSPDFVHGGSIHLSSSLNDTATMIQKEVSTYENLTNSECIQQYGKTISTERGNLLIVSSLNATNKSSLMDAWSYSFYSSVDPKNDYNPFDWICSDPKLEDKVQLSASQYNSMNKPACDLVVSEVQDKSAEWAPYGYLADYCLSYRNKQRCSFNGNVPIIAAVIVCNAVKAIIMLLVAFKLTDKPLITIGDAIESFLQRPDPTTKGICCISRRDIHDYHTYAQHFPDPSFPSNVRPSPPAPQEFSTRKRYWSGAASSTRWTATIALFAAAIGTTGGLLAPALEGIASVGQNTIKNMGFGVLQPESIITGWAIENISVPANQILASVLIANLPQVILSFLYLNLNGLITTMWLAAEWNNFATERKYLRVSDPKGPQRSTHFLQLPYRIAVPLMIMSGLIHYCISQSIFLAVVSEYDADDHLVNAVQIASCGYSVLAIIVTMCLTFGLVMMVVAIGFRKYDGRIPMVGSCSAAISAACHRPDWDSDAALKPLQYGELSEKISGQDPAIGHCCFTSGDVTFVEEGRKYAGIVVKREVKG